jgi:adenosine kinase
LVATHPDIAVIGALAYDQIATTPASLTGSDRQSGTAAQTGTLLNCKIDTLTEAFGGCGGNIAYNLAHNGSTRPLLLSVTGTADDQKYVEHLQALNISSAGLLRVDTAYCARAIIITDCDGHQFTAFFPGDVPSVERWCEHLRSLPLSECPVLVQAPYPPDLMIASLEFAAQLPNKPLKICCPGQYADQLKPTETRELIHYADWVIGNAYEIKHLQRVCSMDDKLILQTNGAKEIQVRVPGQHPQSFTVPAVAKNVDPTGCGDAFIASIANDVVRHGGLDTSKHLADAIQSACRNAALCLGFNGGQLHYSPVGSTPTHA